MIRVSKRFLNAEGKPSIMGNINIIAGLPESDIEDVRISNIRIILPGDVLSTTDFPNEVKENDKGYPENRMFGLKPPANSFYVRHVNGLYLDDISITTQAADIRAAFVFDDVADATLKNIRYNGKLIKENKSSLDKRNNVTAVIKE